MDYPEDIEIDEAQQTLVGPDDIELILDADEIYIDDPGMGTPRIVNIDGETMTLDCAIDNISDIGGTEEQREWLIKMQDKADDWLDEQSELKEEETLEKMVDYDA